MADAIPWRVLGVEVRLCAVLERSVHPAERVEFTIGQRELGQSQNVEITPSWTIVAQGRRPDQIDTGD